MGVALLAAGPDAETLIAYFLFAGLGFMGVGLVRVFRVLGHESSSNRCKA